MVKEEVSDRDKRATPGRRTNRKKTAKTVMPGEEALLRILREAEYEVIDPYRGTVFAAGVESNSSPWKACAFGSVGSRVAEDGISEGDHGTNLVQSIFQCSCPTLTGWANQDFHKQNKKKVTNRLLPSVGFEVLARQHDDWQTSCPCDYNPFCLATLGGVMTQALQMRMRDFEENGDDEVTVADVKEKMYTEATKQRLHDIRKPVLVDQGQVEGYLRALLEKAESPMSADVGINVIRQTSEKLLLQPPHEADTVPEGKIRLSLPPGIENLGATCYLNTQLQCLAQNIVFISGAFSWSPAVDRESDRMSKVVRLFQQLLGRMVAGPQRVVNTVEFSESLGLDINEQQDPNEFSRLFFDKLHETFQHSDESEENRRSLLPSLFQGVMRYETTCLNCSTTTFRKENFMDANVPIVTPPVLGSKTSQPTLADSVKKKQKGTNLQYCFDSHCSPETLNGENQYYCENCDSKQDAKRVPVFEKLPPVLNIQLSRYVFDRASLSKKKVSDEVKLPIQLQVQSGEKPGETVAYILTAVMRHQGRSAYSGHYVGEAMNWQSGMWFEFNDEKVTLLRKGPSCSYMPGGEDDASGSSDAYNMYYIKESFLASSVVSSWDMSCTGLTLQEIHQQRENSYGEVKILCAEDARRHQVLETRKTSLRESVVRKLMASRENKMSDCVWIHTRWLRNFLLCNDEAVEFLDIETFTCPHSSGISPRMARQGKVIPKEIATALLSLHPESVAPESFSIDVPKVGCITCAEEYHAELKAKVDKLRAVHRLYGNLDQSSDNFDLAITSTENEADADSMCAYVLCKKFIASFRARVTGLMKQALAATATCAPLVKDENLFEGLDSFHLVDLAGAATTDDPHFRVNKRITCEHGNCCTTKKNLIRYVPPSVWRDVLLLFPDAVEHKIKRVPYTSPLLPSALCVECAEEHKKSQEASDDLKFLLQRKINVSPVSGTELKPNKQYKLFYKDDLVAWSKFIAGSKRKVSPSSAFVDRNIFERHLPQGEWNKESLGSIQVVMRSSNDTDTLPDEICKRLRPIACTSHWLPLCSALFGVIDFHNAPRPLRLCSQLCILTADQYENLKSHWIEVLRNVQDMDDGTRKESHLLWHHPSFSLRSTNAGFEEIRPCFVLGSDHNDSPSLILDSKVCTDPTCNGAYLEWRANDETKKNQQAEAKRSPIEVVVTDDDDEQMSLLQVFEAEKDADIESIFSSLERATTNNKDNGDPLSTMRRSSRKRKVVYPCGSLLSHDTLKTSRKSNVAALRLLMMQGCRSGTFELFHKVQAILPLKSHQKAERCQFSKEKSVVVGLSLASAADEVKDVVEKNHCGDVSLSELVLVRQATDFDPADGIAQEGLFDYLINLQDNKPGECNNEKKKAVRVEKGFSGTFLTGGSDTTKEEEEEKELEAVDSSSINSPSDKLTQEPEKELEVIGSSQTDHGGNEMIEVIEEDEDDDDDEGLGKRSRELENASPSEAKQRKRNPAESKYFIKTSSESDVEVVKEIVTVGSNNQLDEKVLELAATLSNRQDLQHEDLCREAAKWALATRVDSGSASDIVSRAYAKCLQLHWAERP